MKKGETPVSTVISSDLIPVQFHRNPHHTPEQNVVFHLENFFPAVFHLHSFKTNIVLSTPVHLFDKSFIVILFLMQSAGVYL